MTRVALVLGITVSWLGACGDDGTSDAPDAPADVDAAIDASPTVHFTGELVTWDSTDIDFKGVFNATIAVHSAPATNAKTAPNGRFNLDVPNEAFLRYDVTPNPLGDADNPPDYIQGIGIVTAEDAPLARSSLRTMTPARAADFGFDVTKGQIFVAFPGGHVAATVAATHDPIQAFTTTWAVGATGDYLYIPNVDVGSGSTTVTVAGAEGLPSSVPLEAGKFTYLTAYVP